jgi:hypothetical protein
VRERTSEGHWETDHSKAAKREVEQSELTDSRFHGRTGEATGSLLGARLAVVRAAVTDGRARPSKHPGAVSKEYSADDDNDDPCCGVKLSERDSNNHHHSREAENYESELS